MLKIAYKGTMMSDGRFCSNGDWICDLDKIPLGELLKANIDIVCGKGNQLKLINDKPINRRDFSNVIPFEAEYKMMKTPIVLDISKKGKYRLYQNRENALLAFVNEGYEKIFSDVDIARVATEGQNKLICFYNSDDEFVYGIMPMDAKETLTAFADLIIRRYGQKHD
ncbi:MAG: hypothetical protein ACI4CY_05710 [Candidatus Gastranaerophilaceae bacterium]